ncbi:MAG: signal peptidase I [Candidatus Falkowbacteria bacterium]
MKKIIITIIILAVIIVVGYFVYQKNFFSFSYYVEINYDKSCITTKSERVVRGESLQGIIKNGENIKVWEGYYNCNLVERGDIIIYNYSSEKDPIIKIIKGLPGDKFALKQNEAGNYNIIVNNKILNVSTGQPYELTEVKHRMLALYEKDFKGVIPKDTYLILGNQTNGSLDSTRFGLIDKKGIIGKVIYKN